MVQPFRGRGQHRKDRGRSNGGLSANAPVRSPFACKSAGGAARSTVICNFDTANSCFWPQVLEASQKVGGRTPKARGGARAQGGSLIPVQVAKRHAQPVLGSDSSVPQESLSPDPPVVVF